MEKYLPLYSMLIPGIVYLIINNYIPMAGIMVAFKKYNYSRGFWAVTGTVSKISSFCLRQRTLYDHEKYGLL